MGEPKCEGGCVPTTRESVTEREITEESVAKCEITEESVEELESTKGSAAERESVSAAVTSDRAAAESSPADAHPAAEQEEIVVYGDVICLASSCGRGFVSVGAGARVGIAETTDGLDALASLESRWIIERVSGSSSSQDNSSTDGRCRYGDTIRLRHELSRCMVTTMLTSHGWRGDRRDPKLRRELCLADDELDLEEWAFEGGGPGDAVVSGDELMLRCTRSDRRVACRNFRLDARQGRHAVCEVVGDAAKAQSFALRVVKAVCTRVTLTDGCCVRLRLDRARSLVLSTDTFVETPGASTVFVVGRAASRREAISWGEPVFLRHLLTGRYLAAATAGDGIIQLRDTPDVAIKLVGGPQDDVVALPARGRLIVGDRGLRWYKGASCGLAGDGDIIHVDIVGENDLSEICDSVRWRRAHFALAGVLSAGARSSRIEPSTARLMVTTAIHANTALIDASKRQRDSNVIRECGCLDALARIIAEANDIPDVLFQAVEGALLTLATLTRGRPDNQEYFGNGRFDTYVSLDGDPPLAPKTGSYIDAIVERSRQHAACAACLASVVGGNAGLAERHVIDEPRIDVVDRLYTANELDTIGALTGCAVFGAVIPSAVNAAINTLFPKGRSFLPVLSVRNGIAVLSIERPIAVLVAAVAASPCSPFFGLHLVEQTNYVAVKDIAWTLEPQSKFKSVFGVDWKRDVAANNTQFAVAIQAAHELARSVFSAMELCAILGKGSGSPCKLRAAIEATIPWRALVAMLVDSCLPDMLRVRVARLLRLAYVSTHYEPAALPAVLRTTSELPSPNARIDEALRLTTARCQRESLLSHKCVSSEQNALATALQSALLQEIDRAPSQMKIDFDKFELECMRMLHHLLRQGFMADSIETIKNMKVLMVKIADRIDERSQQGNEARLAVALAVAQADTLRRRASDALFRRLNGDAHHQAPHRMLKGKDGVDYHFSPRPLTFDELAGPTYRALCALREIGAAPLQTQCSGAVVDAMLSTQDMIADARLSVMIASILERAKAGSVLVNKDGKLSADAKSLVSRKYLPIDLGANNNTTRVLSRQSCFKVAAPQLLSASDELCSAALRLTLRRLMPESLQEKLLAHSYLIFGDEASHFMDAMLNAALKLRRDIIELTKTLRFMAQKESSILIRCRCTSLERLFMSAESAAQIFDGMKSYTLHGRAEEAKTVHTDIVVSVQEEYLPHGRPETSLHRDSASQAQAKRNTNPTLMKTETRLAEESALSGRFRAYYLQRQLGGPNLALAAFVATCELCGEIPENLEKLRRASASYMGAHFETGALHVKVGGDAGQTALECGRHDAMFIFGPALFHLAASVNDNIVDCACEALTPLLRIFPKLKVPPPAIRRCVERRSIAAVNLVETCAMTQPLATLRAIVSTFKLGADSNISARLILIAAHCCSIFAPEESVMAHARLVLPLKLACKTVSKTDNSELEAALDAFIVHAHLKDYHEGNVATLDDRSENEEPYEDTQCATDDSQDDEPWQAIRSQTGAEDVRLHESDWLTAEATALTEYALSRAKLLEPGIQGTSRRLRAVKRARAMAVIATVFEYAARENSLISASLSGSSSSLFGIVARTARSALESKRFPRRAMETTWVGQRLCSIFNFPRSDEQLPVFDPLLASPDSEKFAAFEDEGLTADLLKPVSACHEPTYTVAATGLFCGGTVEQLKEAMDQLHQFAELQRGLCTNEFAKDEEIKMIADALLTLPLNEQHLSMSGVFEDQNEDDKAENPASSARDKRARRRSGSRPGIQLPQRESVRTLTVSAPSRSATFEAVTTRLLDHTRWCASGAQASATGACEECYMASRDDPVRATIDLWLEIPPGQSGTHGRDEVSRCALATVFLRAVRHALESWESRAAASSETDIHDMNGSGDVCRPAATLSAIELQDVLVQAGGATLVVDVVKNLHVRKTKGAVIGMHQLCLAVEASRLSGACLAGGHAAAQHHVARRIRATGGEFLMGSAQLFEDVAAAFAGLDMPQNARREIGHKMPPGLEANDRLFDHLLAVLKMLQLFAEGHNRESQHLLADTDQKLCVLCAASHLFVASMKAAGYSLANRRRHHVGKLQRQQRAPIAGSSTAAVVSDEARERFLRIALLTVALLVEATQGPCFLSQETLLFYDRERGRSMLAALAAAVDVNSVEAGTGPQNSELRAASLKLFLALIEGRSNGGRHCSVIASYATPALLRAVIVESAEQSSLASDILAWKWLDPNLELAHLALELAIRLCSREKTKQRQSVLIESRAVRAGVERSLALFLEQALSLNEDDNENEDSVSQITSSYIRTTERPSSTMFFSSLEKFSSASDGIPSRLPWRSQVNDTEKAAAMRAAARIGNGTGSVEVALDESSIVVALFPWPREVDFLTSTLKTRTLDAIDVTSEDHLGELLLVQGPKLLDELGFLADTQELPARRLLLDLALTFETLAPYVVAALAAVLLVQLEYKLHGSVHARGSRYSKPPRFRNIWGKYLAVGLNAALVALNFVLVAAAVVKHGALRMRARSRIEAKDQGSTTATAARMSVEEAKRISLAASVVGRDTTRRQTFWMRALCVAAFFMAFSVLLRFTFGDPSTRVGRPSTIIIVVATTSCALIFLKDVRTHTGAILGGSEGVSGSNLVFASYKFVFDVVTTVDVANRILWLVLSTLALFIGVRRAPALACAQLVDIARSSETLRDVIRAVVRPILSGSLAVTGVFTLLVLLLFSFVAFIHLAADYRELSDDDDDFSVIHHCDDLVNCFATVLHFGLLAGGGMGDYLSFEVGAVPGRDWSFRRRLARMLFDLSFFIIVVVLLLNLVFGIIIDTFSQLRDIANERKGVLQGRCFVCGVARTSFEDSRRCVHVGNAPWYIWSPAPGGFVRHVHYEHNMWAYLLFVEHLARKPPTEYNGVESSVARRLNAGDLSWIPSGDSLILQAWTNKRN